MLVYDITNEKSFDNIKNWIRNIEEVGLSRACACSAVVVVKEALVFNPFCFDAARLRRCREDGPGK